MILAVTVPAMVLLFALLFYYSYQDRLWGNGKSDEKDPSVKVYAASGKRGEVIEKCAEVFGLEDPDFSEILDYVDFWGKDSAGNEYGWTEQNINELKDNSDSISFFSFTLHYKRQLLKKEFEKEAETINEVFGETIRKGFKNKSNIW